MSEKKSRVESPKLKAGRCRYCGCTEGTPCLLALGGVVSGCWWVDKARPICSSRQCMRQAVEAGLMGRRSFRVNKSRKRAAR